MYLASFVEKNNNQNNEENRRRCMKIKNRNSQTLKVLKINGFMVISLIGFNFKRIKENLSL